ncbi:hypothetical protein HED60_16880 [Planctomycetales bacterium ZRK34]|nr:hypothetical protein HED60_16880 [Planctomycetales bacterium ZRK34]
MDQHAINRRDFGKLAAAAFGGMVTGTVLGGRAFAGEGDSLLLSEPHVCRGLNTCKGKGSCKTADNACKGHNDCAGAGGCATAEKHGCSGENACKGQGGCGSKPGENACKGKGKCAVPLHKGAWEKARKNFETAYKAKFGKDPMPAPAAA